MTPYKYTNKGNGKITFHYTFKQYYQFLKHGFLHGDNGWILIGREGTTSIYKGFGTIENPSKTLITISLVHCEMYDGKLQTPEEIINPPYRVAIENIESYRFTILKFK